MGIPGEEAFQHILAALEGVTASQGMLPVGNYRFNVERAETLPADGMKKQRLVYHMKVLESAPSGLGLEGREHDEYFNTGSVADPSGADPQAIQSPDNFGAKMLKGFKERLGSGTQVVGVVTPRIDNTGQLRTGVSQWFPATTDIKKLPPPSNTPRQPKAPSGQQQAPVAAPPKQVFQLATEDDEPEVAQAPANGSANTILCPLNCGGTFPVAALSTHIQTAHAGTVAAVAPKKAATKPQAVAVEQE